MTTTERIHRSDVRQSIALLAIVFAVAAGVVWMLSRLFNR